ncbi:uncharacterized protein LOC122254891 [Penaeus japonicus]|uniref:uncharacterized protein LOC122254891 n=1 Tax=Penaeus japonicus TaxID=27405 RepID=UPI001C715582|nr:uncharacterized protein LOC122254891 [Penaeus japonicus]
MVAAGGRMVLAQLMIMNHILVTLSSASEGQTAIESANMSPSGSVCGEGCAKCSPVNGCLACNASFALLVRRQGPRQTASCSRFCPRGFYRVNVDVYAFCRRCTMIGCSACSEADLCTACDRGYAKVFGSCVYRGEEFDVYPETSTLQPPQEGLPHASTSTFASTSVTTSTSTSTSATSLLPIPNTPFSEPLTDTPRRETKHHITTETATSRTDGNPATWDATRTPTVDASEFTDVATDVTTTLGRGGGGGEGEEEEEGEGEGGPSERPTSATRSTKPSVPDVTLEESIGNPVEPSFATALGLPTAPSSVETDLSPPSGRAEAPATEEAPPTDANQAEKPCRGKWRLWRERYRRLFCRVAEEKRKKTSRHCKHRRKMCKRHRHSRGKHKASAGGQRNTLEQQQSTCGSPKTDARAAVLAAAAVLGCWGVAVALGPSAL